MGEELLTREQWTIQARESSYGTDEIDLATNNAGSSVSHRFEAYTNVSVALNGDFRERDIARASFSSNRGQFIRKNQTWTVEGIVPCPATAGDAPLGLADLLVASGCTEALVDDTTATYGLSTTATAGLSMYHWKRLADAATQQLIYGTGIRGNMEFAFSVRDYARFTFTGESNSYPLDSTKTSNPHGWSKDLGFIDLSDASFALDQNGAAITHTGTQTGDDPRGLFLETAAILTVDSVAIPVSGGSVNFNNNVVVRGRTSSSTESGPVLITGRSIQPTFTFETMTAWEKAADLLHADSEVSATLVLTDGLGSGGTTLTFTWPKLQVRGLEGPSDANGLANWSLPCQANGNHTDGIGDDEMTIVWSVTA